MSLPETPEAFIAWREAARLTNEALDRAEATQWRFLDAMGLPRNAVEIADILENKRPYEWKAKRENRDRWRAERAMQTLCYIDNARAYLQRANLDGQKGAYWALMVGLHAGDAAFSILQQLNASRTGRRGATTTNDNHDLKTRRRNAAILLRAKVLHEKDASMSIRAIAHEMAKDRSVGISEDRIRAILNAEHKTTPWFVAKVAYHEAEIRRRSPKRLSQRAVARELGTHPALSSETEPTIRKALRHKTGSSAPRRSTP